MAKMKTHFWWSTSIIKQNINNEAGNRGLVQMGMAIWCWKDYRVVFTSRRKTVFFLGLKKWLEKQEIKNYSWKFTWIVGRIRFDILIETISWLACNSMVFYFITPIHPHDYNYKGSGRHILKESVYSKMHESFSFVKFSINFLSSSVTLEFLSKGEILSQVL